MSEWSLVTLGPEYKGMRKGISHWETRNQGEPGRPEPPEAYLLLFSSSGGLVAPEGLSKIKARILQYEDGKLQSHIKN